MNDASRPIARTPITELDIRIVTTAAERHAVARLRYEVYVAEMGLPQPHADHEARTVCEPLDEEGVVFGAFEPDGRLVATLRLNAASDPRIPYRELYGWDQLDPSTLRECFLGSKLIVDAAHRGSRLSFKVLRAATAERLQNGFRYSFLEAYSYLVPLYEPLGYVALRTAEDPTFGAVTIMRWDMHDLEHMRRVRSPLLRECARHMPLAV